MNLVDLMSIILTPLCWEESAKRHRDNTYFDHEFSNSFSRKTHLAKTTSQPTSQWRPDFNGSKSCIILSRVIVRLPNVMLWFHCQDPLDRVSLSHLRMAMKNRNISLLPPTLVQDQETAASTVYMPMLRLNILNVEVITIEWPRWESLYRQQQIYL